MTPDSDLTIANWRTFLMVLGLAAIALATVLEVVSITHHQVTSVAVTGTKPDLTTTTTAGPSGPPTAILTAVIATGVILILIAAFFTRVTKVSIMGAELDVDTASALAGTVAARTHDATEAAALYKASLPMAAEALADRTPTSRVRVRRQVEWRVQPALDDTTLNHIVDAAQRQ